MTAIQDNNYCSIHNPEGKYDSRSNSFYLRSSQLESGEHISRYSVRSVLRGYQYYNINNDEHLLTDENYLIVNKGQRYYSEINSVSKTESVIVALDEDLIREVYFTLTQPLNKVLNNDSFQSDIIEFFENSYTQNKSIRHIFKTIKNEILDETKDPLVYQHLHYWLIQELILNHLHLVNKVIRKGTSRKSTLLELYRRLSLAKDFMDASYSRRLSIEEISQQAALSPFHFIREFKKFFGMTPLNYLEFKTFEVFKVPP